MMIHNKYSQKYLSNFSFSALLLDSGDFLGEAVCPVHKIVGAPGQQVSLDLNIKGAPAGKLIARAEEKLEIAEKQHLVAEVAGVHLEFSTCCLCSVSPRLDISRILENNDLQVVHRSDVRSGNSVQWMPLDITLQKLSNGDRLRPILFEVVHAEGSGRTLIGECELSVNNILGDNTKFELKHPQQKGKNVGYLEFHRPRIEQKYTFVDYIAGGCEIGLTCAVDFTGSNGNPRTPNSLHYQFQDGRLNEYEAALTAVGDILLHYDQDKLVPMYGFGAYNHSLGPGVHHCFPMNNNPANPEVYGLDGMFDTYKQTISSVELSGPTYFGSILGTMMKKLYAMQNEGGQKYSILMILTDGAIHDYDSTVRQLVEASHLPLSVIIVGVGNADFDAMDDLDCDNGVLKDSYGRAAERDIVQFVPFRECSRDINALRKRVLAEIPEQLTRYFSLRGISPNPKVEVDYPSF